MKKESGIVEAAKGTTKDVFPSWPQMEQALVRILPMSLAPIAEEVLPSHHGDLVIRKQMSSRKRLS